MIIQNRRLGDIVFKDKDVIYSLKHMEYMEVTEETGKLMTNLKDVVDMSKIVKPTSREQILEKELAEMKAKMAEMEVNKEPVEKEYKKKGK